MFSIVVLMILIIDLATDVYAPSLPLVAELWNLPEEVAVFSVSINLFAMALSSIYYGLVGDTLSKKKILIWAFVIFTIGTLGCFLSPNFNSFLSLRFIQGLGGGVSYLGFAYLKNFYDEIQYAKKLSILNAIISLSPGLGPIIGSFVSCYFSWQINFLALFIISCLVILLMPFYLRNDKTKVQSNQEKLIACKNFLINKQARFYCLIYIFTMSWCWADLSNLPIIYITNMGVKNTNYGYYMLSSIGAYIFGCLYNNYFLEGKVSVDTTLRLGILLVLFSASLVIVTIYILKDAILIHFFKLISYFGMALILGNAMTKAFSYTQDSSAMVSSLLNFSQLITGSFVCFIIALLGKGTIEVLSAYILLVGLITAIYSENLNKGIKHDSIR